MKNPSYLETINTIICSKYVHGDIPVPKITDIITNTNLNKPTQLWYLTGCGQLLVSDPKQMILRLMKSLLTHIS